jgi:hypothetical protein
MSRALIAAAAVALAPMAACHQRAAVVFRTHPELADLLTRWFDAVLNGTPATLPVTNGRPLAPAVLRGLKTIDRPGGAAEVPSTPPLPEYIVNWLGYEHLAMKDTDTALAINGASARPLYRDRGRLPRTRRRA